MRKCKCSFARHCLKLVAAAVLAAAFAPANAATAGALERVRAGKLVLGYRTDNAPLSYRTADGKPAGYAVALCQQVAEDLKTQLQLPALAVEWVEVNPSTAVQDLQQGRIDLLCNGETASLAQREHTSFTIPIFLGGIAAVVRKDAPADFQRSLESRPEPYKPIWRGTPPAALQHKTVSAVAGSTTVELLAQRIRSLKMVMNIATVESYAAGMASIAKGKSDALFGDREQLLALMRSDPGADLKILDRRYTYKPLAMALARNDDDFRLAVDRALVRIYTAPKFGELYQTQFGKADDETIDFFRSQSQ